MLRLVDDEVGPDLVLTPQLPGVRRGPLQARQKHLRAAANEPSASHFLATPWEARGEVRK
jgi:hypothetical protein